MTKVMTCNTPSVPPLQTQNGQLLENITDFKYLGSWVNSTTQDVKIRKALAWKALNDMKMVLVIKYFKRTQAQVLLRNCRSYSPVRKRVLGNECLTAEIA